MSQSQTVRPEYFQLQNGNKARLPFSDAEYESRLGKLRTLMSDVGVDAMLLTSMHNIAYYSGFLYCSFGRPYACVVTADRCVTVSANVDAHELGLSLIKPGAVCSDICAEINRFDERCPVGVDLAVQFFTHKLSLAL